MSTRSEASASMKDGREPSMVDYRDVLGWPVGEEVEGITLRLGWGVGAVEFPAGRGRDVIAVLRTRDSVGPALVLPGRQWRWVCLTAGDDPGAAGSCAAMLGARLRMTAPDVLVLPPGGTPHGPVRWIVAPWGGHGRLPTLQSVLSAAWQTVSV